MAKSLLWRWLIIVVIVAGWFYSIFPPTDRDFFDVFRKEAAKNITLPADTANLDQLMALAQAKYEASQAAASGAAIPADAATTDTATVTTPAGGPITKVAAVEMAAREMNLQLHTLVPLYNKPAPQNKEVLEYVHRLSRGKMRLGLDLSGGTEFIVAFDEDAIKTDHTPVQVREQITEILRSRIDQSGVLEAEIMPIGPNAISLKIPTINAQDTDRFRELILQQAKLQFGLVHPENESLAEEEAVEGYQRFEYRHNEDGQERVDILWIQIEGLPKVSGENIVKAGPSVGELGQWQVNFQFDAAGATAFAELSGNHLQERLAIILDGDVKSAPVLQSRISSSGQITGNFTQEEAKQLGVVLQCGNLPVDIKIEGQMSTDPTLGADAVHSGKVAAIAGVICVMIFMVIYYMVPGIIACIALMTNMVLILGTLPILDATITLPGLAGLVLTIGMSVDANVLIFERIREELDSGKSLANAISRGYASAFSAIVDSNLTTFFTAFILMKFGSGPIKGFGVMLTIGIVASMFTAIFVTRAIFDLLLHKEWLKGKLKMLQFMKPGHVPYVSYRKLAYFISGSLVLLSLITFGLRGRDAAGVEFRGGTQITYKYSQQVPTDSVIKALEGDAALALKGIRISYKEGALEDGKEMDVVIGKDFAEGVDPAAAILSVLNQQFPDAGYQVGSTTRVGGLVGESFTRKAFWSLFWAVIMIIVYVSFRFEFSYALGAVVALVHDALIATGIFLLWGMGDRQLSLTAIAAILTTVGYSINDTIVVFDRVRENVGLLKNAKLEDIINMSVNQTMSRTILTSLTTLIAVLVLYFFGGGAINDFALIMLLGILVGAYSTIFIAAPVTLAWQHWRARVHAATPASEKNKVSA